MKYKEKNFLSAVVYVHDNEDLIEDFIRKLSQILTGHFEKYEIICVNDKSTDGSLQKLKACAANLQGVSISVVNMSFYQGIELSMNAGVDLAIGDFVFEFDNIYIDYDLELIMQVYRQSLQGFDIVSASPEKGRRLSSSLFYTLFNRNAGLQYNLDTESFRILSRRAINRVHSVSSSIPYRKAIYANCGLKLFNITYKPIENAAAQGKKVEAFRWDNAINSLILFTDVAYKFTLFMTLIMTIATIVMAAYACFVFLSANPVAGWTTTMLFLSVGLFGVFIVLAVILKYLSVLISLVFTKQTYIIEGIEKVN